jgi:hypothetical protein
MHERLVRSRSIPLLVIAKHPLLIITACRALHLEGFALPLISQDEQLLGRVLVIQGRPNERY